MLGAVHPTVALAFPPVALTPLGAPGAVGAVGVTAFEALEAGPGPAPLVAATVNVYAVPSVSPVIVVLVVGGDPVIVVWGWAVLPM